MTDSSDNTDDWEYLSGVLGRSNNDEDLLDEAAASDHSSANPKSPLESQIQRLTTGDAPFTTIRESRIGKVHLHGQFRQIAGRYTRQGMHVTEGLFSDDTGSVRVVWFNQPFKAAAIKRDVTYELRGTLSLRNLRLQVSNANIRLLSEGCAPFAKRGAKK